eukprot:4224717-Pleurochrysis_carterae.AAC.3
MQSVVCVPFCYEHAVHPLCIPCVSIAVAHQFACAHDVSALYKCRWTDGTSAGPYRLCEALVMVTAREVST